MDKRAFRCRLSGSLIFGIAFLLLGSLFFLIPFLSILSNDAGGSNNSHDSSGAFVVAVIIAFVGLSFFAASIYMWRSWFFERVEFDPEELIKYDGPKHVETRLRISEVNDVGVVEEGRLRGYITVTAGATCIEIPTSVLHYDQVLEMVKGFSTNERKIETLPSMVSNLATMKPLTETRTFSYRFSSVHIMSFCAFAFLVFDLVRSSLTGNSIIGDRQLSVVVYGILAITGTWSQLVGWNEKITLGPEGLKWNDWKGSQRVTATLSQIQTVTVFKSAKSGKTVIETEKGTIKVAAYIRNYEDLIQEVQRIIDKRS